jgi:hypothetical protein
MGQEMVMPRLLESPCMLYYAVPTHVGAPQSKMAALAGLCLAYYLYFRFSELMQESTSSSG